MTSDDKLLETRLVRMRGQVQGIGYREACVRRALIDEFEVTELPAPFARFDAFDRLPTL